MAKTIFDDDFNYMKEVKENFFKLWDDANIILYCLKYNKTTINFMKHVGNKYSVANFNFESRLKNYLKYYFDEYKLYYVPYFDTNFIIKYSPLITRVKNEYSIYTEEIKYLNNLLDDFLNDDLDISSFAR